MIKETSEKCQGFSPALQSYENSFALNSPRKAVPQNMCYDSGRMATCGEKIGNSNLFNQIRVATRVALVTQPERCFPATQPPTYPHLLADTYPPPPPPLPPPPLAYSPPSPRGGGRGGKYEPRGGVGGWGGGVGWVAM